MSDHDKHGAVIATAVESLREEADVIRASNTNHSGEWINTAAKDRHDKLVKLAADLENMPALSAPSATLPTKLLDDAADIYDLMLRSSKTCRPMEHLLTTDGFYHLNIADLRVRSDGIEYVMQADWAKLCGKLVKAMKELRDSSAVTETEPRGTFACPRCGRVEPHYHAPDDEDAVGIHKSRLDCRAPGACAFPHCLCPPKRDPLPSPRAEADAAQAKDAARYRKFKAVSGLKQIMGHPPFWSTRVTLDGTVSFDEAIDKLPVPDGTHGE